MATRKTPTRRNAVKLAELQAGFIAATDAAMAPVEAPAETLNDNPAAEPDAKQAPLPAAKPELMKSANEVEREKREADKLAQVEHDKTALSAVEAAVGFTDDMSVEQKVERLFVLCDAEVSKGAEAEMSTAVLSLAMEKMFGKEWPTYTDADTSDEGERGRQARSLFTFKRAYYDRKRKNHTAPGKCVPSVAWGRLVKASVTRFNLTLTGEKATDGEKGKGEKKSALQALRRDLPGLYIRANNDAAFDKSENLRNAAFKLGEALAFLLNSAEMLDLNGKLKVNK